MIIRIAEKKDVDRIMQIIADARESIGRLGIDQWQYGYPTREIVKEDIMLERGFVAVEDGEILATFALMLHGEPTYKKIYCGAWLSEGEYLALHRIAIDSNHRGRGVAEKIVEFLLEYANENGYSSIRVDTHQGNEPMRKMLQKNGFEYCGSIRLLDGQERVAYERLV
ncbi:MAG: GNAT family N-acetyltransferase [Clostridia bacterium]|nr:GNAT family N-acetyltransferase [Clostridia bacterium]